MRKWLWIGLATLVAGSASAQEERQVRPPAPDILPPGTCPPNGYAPPLYGVFGDNDGVVNAYEIAGPCTPKELRDAAEAIGMGRYRPLGVKNVTTVRFFATGSLANERGVLEKVAKLDVNISYVVPGIRMVVDRIDKGRPARDVRVYADEFAWNEREPGVDPTPAAAMLARRAPLLKLTPFGALWSVIEAEGTAKVARVGAQTIITGASPYDGYEVAMTLDEKHLPIYVRVKAHGKVFEASFADYRDTWEPPYLVIFPSKLTWKLDGKPLADLTVTEFKSNGYAVFPIPEAVKAKSAGR